MTTKASKDVITDSFMSNEGDLMDGDLSFQPGSQVFAGSGSLAAPSYAFSGDGNTGITQTGTTEEIHLVTNGVSRLEIESNGTLNVAGTAGYEALVTLDDDIPNKKYVVDADALKLSKIGGTLTGELSISYNTSTPTYSTGHLELITNNGSDVSMGFHRGGFTACQLRHASNGLILSGTAQTTAADFYCYGSIFSNATQSTSTNAVTRKDYVDGLSDLRVKDNVVAYSTAVEDVKKMNFFTYTLNEKSHKPNTNSIGLIAQELKVFLPDLVHKHQSFTEDAEGNQTEATEDDKLFYVDRDGLLAIALQAVKELTARLEALENS